MVTIKDKLFKMTRGDSCVVSLTIYEHDGETIYTPTEDDLIYLTIKPDVNNEYYVLKKPFVDGDTLVFYKEDTINLNFGEYFYDVRLENNTNIDTVLDQGVFIIEGGTANAGS